MNRGIRDKYHCMIAGIENEDGALMVPDVNVPLVEGDVVWVVGEKEDVYQLIDQKAKKYRSDKIEHLFLFSLKYKIIVS